MSLKYEVTLYIDTFIEYKRHDLNHRVSRPAVIRRHTHSMFWYEYGKSHRKDGPCDVYTTGERYYRIRGRYVPAC